MDDFEDVVETDTVDTDVSSTPAIDNNASEPIATPQTIKKSRNKGYETLLKRSIQNTADELRNQATFIGEQERLGNDKIAAQTAIYNDTLDNVARTAVVFPVNSDGTIHFPEIQPPEELKTPEERDRYTRDQKRIQDRLKYILNEYDEAKTTSGDNLKYIAGSAVRSGINLVSESLGTVPIVGGMAVQAIGTLGGQDNFVTRNGVLMQEWTVNLLDSINDSLTDALINERRATEVGREAAKVIDTGAQVAAIAASVYAGGASIAGKVSRKAAARGISEAAAKRASQTAAKTFAERAGNITSAMYASAQTENYLTRPREGMSNEEYLEYLKSKTGGEILGDLAFGALVGVSNYYLEKTFGAEASIKNFFGSAADGFVRLATRRAYEEGLTEIAQDEVLDVFDLFRGYILGNETRKISGMEFLENLISPQTLETFVVSAIIGGATASAEYRSARVNLVKEYKQGLKKVFPNATEEQLETASKAFVNSTEDSVVAKVHQSLIADDQLRNQYGTYNTIVQNRINELINQSIARGEELDFGKTPEEQAQRIGSLAQQVVDELYAQAINRKVPINEVFDVTKIDVKDGVMYMYGEEYGRRPLTALTKNLTPAQYEQMQAEKRVADNLQKQQKEQEKQIKEALKEAKKREREAQRELAKQKKQAEKDAKAMQKAQAKRERIQETQDKVLARVEIRGLDENKARGILAILRPDLPVRAMKKGEIKTILRSEIDNYVALQNRDQIQPIERQKPARQRQKQAVQEEVFNQAIREQSDIAAENERLDAENEPYTGDTIVVNGVERTVYNSNGDRIAKSEAALKNFWNWFGDSKVVDDKGRPLVVYHGTSSDFDTFDMDESGKNTGTAIYGRGFYFTTNKDVATKWGAKRGEPRVISAYIKLENPNMVEALSYPKDSQEKGFDGVIAQVWGEKDLEIVAFESNQIKSTENRGTFSPDTGNIYQQKVDKKTLGEWNPLRKSIRLFSGANETTLAHELSHFWLDNMMMYSRLNAAVQNQGFMAVWNNIKKYLNIDDRQERVSQAQAEKYASAYLQYIKDSKTAPAMDLGFKGLNEYFADISEEYFENALHRDEGELDTYSELEDLTPEIVDALQKLTTVDLSQYKQAIEFVNKDKKLLDELNETDRMVEKGDITLEQKEQLDAANVSAYAVNNAIDNMDTQEKQIVESTETIETLDQEQEKTENDIKKFDVEGGNTNSLQHRLNMIALAKNIAENNAALEKHDTHRDMLKVAEAADAFVNSRLEDAKLIVDGKMAEQDGLFASDLYTALERKAIADNDADLIDFLRHSKVANQLAKELGQRVAGFRNYNGDGSFDIMSALKSLDKKYEKGYGKKAQEEVQSELKALDNEIEQQDIAADSKIDDFLEEIRCK